MADTTREPEAREIIVDALIAHDERFKCPSYNCSADVALAALDAAGYQVAKLEHVGWHNSLHPGEFSTYAQRPPYPWEPLYRRVSPDPEREETR